MIFQKNIHPKTILGKLIFSAFGCEELLLGPLGAAVSREEEIAITNFFAKIFLQNYASENIFFRFLEQLIFSTSCCEELLLGPLGAAAGH